ncbi:unnamed protein product, partial [Ectocarpus sp. 4 AP-2014]
TLRLVLGTLSLWVPWRPSQRSGTLYTYIPFPSCRILRHNGDVRWRTATDGCVRRERGKEKRDGRRSQSC